MDSRLNRTAAKEKRKRSEEKTFSEKADGNVPRKKNFFSHI